MEINGIKVAKWAETEFRRKARAEHRTDFFLNVRIIFVLLLLVTVFVFEQNHFAKIEEIALAGINRVIKKPAALSDRLRDNALKRENEINAINDQPKPQS